MKTQKDLIVLTIDLGDKKDEIHIKSSDTPQFLSQQFCKKHCLDSSAESAISYYISQNLLKLSFTPQPVPKSPQNPPPTIEEFPNSSRLTRGSSEKHPKKMRTKASPPNQSLEPGERLYYNSIEKLKQKEKRIEKLLADREANEVNGLTFRPNINKNSAKRVKGNLESEFMNRHKIFQEQLKYKQLERLQDELKDCTFHPDVNRSSSKIDKVRTGDRNLHLYYSAERNRKNSERTSRKEMGKGAGKGQGDKKNGVERVNLSETVERLMKYQEKYSNNIKKIKERNMESEKFDKETGRELFQPCINSPKVGIGRSFLAGNNLSISGAVLENGQRSSRNLVSKVKLIRYEEISKKK